MSYRNYATANSRIVDPSGNGDFTTIAAALTASSSGQTIFIRPGTYTENLTLKSGVDLCSFGGEGYTPNVTIVGNCTATFAGACAITGIRLQTNSAAFLTVSGSSNTVVNVSDCYLNCSNATGITYSTSGSAAEINFTNCKGNIGTTGISLFTATSSSAVGMRFFQSFIQNSGAATTASSTSACGILIQNCNFNFALSTSSTGVFIIQNSSIDCSAINTTCLTTAGTGASNAINYGILLSGSASAVSVGSGTTVGINSARVNSSNTNAITGAGTASIFNVVYNNIAKTNVTTQTGGAAFGLTQGTAPTAGCLGEQITGSRVVGSPLSLSNTTAANVASISLTPGIWDVSAVLMAPAQTCTGTAFIGVITTSSASSSGNDGDNKIYTGYMPTTAFSQVITIPSYRITLSATTTVYLVAQANFSAGTCSAFGTIRGTRVG